MTSSNLALAGAMLFMTVGAALTAGSLWLSWQRSRNAGSDARRASAPRLAPRERLLWAFACLFLIVSNVLLWLAHQTK